MLEMGDKDGSSSSDGRKKKTEEKEKEENKKKSIVLETACLCDADVLSRFGHFR